MKVNMTFAVEWTTKAVVKEPDKIRAGPGMEPWPLRWPDATLYLYWANHANWRAGHCEFAIDGGNDMNWNNEMNDILNADY